ncbi:hypothetical protein KI387_015661 [Taxus chinensis]|uniref:FLZ-type domain-containing protein n=1 Tax=Taxus chinensis TaxID=29808 RepID=A0AA38LHH2_TAXCH|nr:hypothetical protein KI387_015661 [Taxus chinensis]
MLGKRPRPLMNRTTSMSHIGTVFEMVQENVRFPLGHMEDFSGPRACYSGVFFCGEEPAQAHFLDACRMCNRRLGDGRDIYMYRGDSAFCSEECRQQQIAIDERKEKSSANVTGMKKGKVQVGSSSSSTNNKANFKAQAETVAAA